MLAALGLGACKRASPLELVPKDISALAVADPQALFADNMRLARALGSMSWSVAQEARAAGLFSTADLPLRGRVFAFTLVRMPQAVFLVYRGRPAPAWMERTTTQLLPLVGMGGTKPALVNRHAGHGLGIAALCSQAQRHQISLFIDSLTQGQYSMLRQDDALASALATSCHLMVYIPNVSAMAGSTTPTSTVDTTLLNGSLTATSNLYTSGANVDFAFTPAPGNPLYGKPLLGDALGLCPPPGATTDTTSYISFRVAKKPALRLLARQRPWRTAMLLADLVKFPLPELVGALSGDGYVSITGNGLEGSYTGRVSNKAMVARSMRGMLANGALSGAGNPYSLLGSEKFHLGQRGSLLTLYSGAVAPLPKLLASPGAGCRGVLQHKALSAIAQWGGVPASAKTLLASAKPDRLTFSLSNDATGAVAGSIAVSHHLNLAALADTID